MWIHNSIQCLKSISAYTINKILPILSLLLPDSDGLLQPLSHAHLDVKTIVYEKTDCNTNKLNQINQLVYMSWKEIFQVGRCEAAKLSQIIH